MDASEKEVMLVLSPMEGDGDPIAVPARHVVSRIIIGLMQLVNSPECEPLAKQALQQSIFRLEEGLHWLTVGHAALTLAESPDMTIPLPPGIIQVPGSTKPI